MGSDWTKRSIVMLTIMVGFSAWMVWSMWRSSSYDSGQEEMCKRFVERVVSGFDDAHPILRKCDLTIAATVKALPDSRFDVKGGALFMNDSVYSLSAAKVSKGRLKLGEVTIPAVRLEFGKEVVRLHFQRQEDADKAFAKIGDAIADIGAQRSVSSSR